MGKNLKKHLKKAPENGLKRPKTGEKKPPLVYNGIVYTKKPKHKRGGTYYVQYTTNIIV